MSTTAPQPDPADDLRHDITSLRRRSTTLMIARAISYILYAWVIISLIILAFGFFLLLFGANPDAPFTDWVYRHLNDVMEPFRGIFPQQSTPSGSTLDVSVLFAMFVYSLLALGARSLVDWLTYRRDRLDRRIRRDQALLERARIEAAQRRAESAQGSTQPTSRGSQQPGAGSAGW